jgi:YHS domain-containing protein
MHERIGPLRSPLLRHDGEAAVASSPEPLAPLPHVGNEAPAHIVAIAVGQSGWPPRGGTCMSRTLLSLLTTAVLVGATFAVAATTPAAKPAAKPQTTCPVTGKAIDPMTSPHVDWEGQRIYFADQAAANTFRNDPEEVFAKVATEGITLENIQTSCPVSDEALEGGDMGPPVARSHKGRTIMFCCNMCPKKFDKEPAKYLAKLPGEQPKGRD